MLIISITTVYLCIFISVVNGNLPNKLYGGNLVGIYYHPHQVSVQYCNKHICGGVIISKYHILTASSCVQHNDNVFYANIQVLTGTDNINPALNEHGIGNFYEVSFIILHENYHQHNNWINDIAILKLSSEIQFTLLCKPVRLTNTCSSTRKHITGWGEDSVTGILNNNLQRLWIRSTTSRSCAKKYNLPIIFHQFQYCFLPTVGQVTKGSGGSPVMAGKEVAGIISIIHSDRRYPVIYTYAPSYYYWINSVMSKI